MSGIKIDFEHQAREELISRIGENVDLDYNPLLEDKFGITTTEDFDSLSICKLIEIADFLDEIFC